MSVHPAEQHAGDVDALVVGAGFAGLYALFRLRGLGMRVRCLEAGSGVGGTWFWNRYPGARCDVESLHYSYSFSPELEQEWEWTEKYPRQPEILSYLNHVADRFDLRRHVHLSTRVVSATFDDLTGHWTMVTQSGVTHTARYCVMAVGCLSERKDPSAEFAGIDAFRGTCYLTSDWPAEGVDFTGQRVGVIGTGSSGVQAIPAIAEQAESLTVFQRTANFSVPAHNRRLAAGEQDAIKADYPAQREAARESAFGLPVDPPIQSGVGLSPAEAFPALEKGWQTGGGPAFMLAFTDVMTRQETNDLVAEFIREKIRSIVKDPAVAETLCPRDYPVGTKRLTVDTGYFETFNRENVTLVDVRDAPIARFTPSGMELSDGQAFALDAVVFAIGFDAMTGALLAIDIRGRNGVSLRERWTDGPATYLGIGSAGFPNLFFLTGPGSPSVLSNVVVSIEQHVEWLADALAYMQEHSLDTFEATVHAQERWMRHVSEAADATLFPQANSWYLGANVPGKPRVFSPYVAGVGTFRHECEAVAADGYAGVTLSRHARQPEAIG